MGMGWKVRHIFDSERSCKCGKGKVVVYKLEEESEYPPFERDGGYSSELKCPDKCEYQK